jgi:hypothetical protein
MALRMLKRARVQALKERDRIALELIRRRAIDVFLSSWGVVNRRAWRFVLRVDQDLGFSGAPLPPASTRARWLPGRLEVFGLAFCSIVAIADTLSGEGIVLIGLLAIGPAFSVFTRRWTWTAITGVWAVGLAVPLGIADGIWTTNTHFAHLAVVLAVTVLSTLAAAQTATRQPRRRLGDS